MNAPAPYMGQEKYIFISYSHRDSAQVYPIIGELNRRGYRVWYDSGIDPGTEWDENIAQHINACGYFIAFMSGNYLGSNNCKDELNYARDLEKERLLVYLEDVQLPSGMAMRVNRLQSIFKYVYTDEADFYSKLCTARGIDVCLDGAAAPASAPATATAPASAPVGHGTYAPPAAPHTQGTYRQPTQPQGGYARPNAQPGAQPGAYRPPVQPNQGGYTQPGVQPGAYRQPAAQPVYGKPVPVKNKLVAALLAIFLGGIGIQHFYLGKTLFGVLSLVFFWTYVPAIIGLVQGVLILISSDEKFQNTYKCRLR